MKFVLIPPGEFTMGGAPDEIKQVFAAGDLDREIWTAFIESEAPPHPVVLTQPIYMGVNEVTQNDYLAVTGTNPAHFSSTGSGKDAVVDLDTRNHSVEMVSWSDAAAFCAKLSQRENLAPASLLDDTATTRGGTAYRLPTEAEWEFACRAGTTTKFWMGDKWEDAIQFTWYYHSSNGNHGRRTHAVGERAANPLGLFDIHGNVCEWVDDWYDPTFYAQFTEQSAIDPCGPSSNHALRVVRGGSLYHALSSSRSSCRSACPPLSHEPYIGFRVALSVGAVKSALATQPDNVVP